MSPNIITMNVIVTKIKYVYGALLTIIMGSNYKSKNNVGIIFFFN